MAKKLVIGWFTFTCSEDSTIVFTELLNEHFFEWREKIEFRYCRVLKKNNELRDLDVAFVEGAIATKEDEEKLREIRANCKRLVAIGACACTGMPSAQRNFFDEATRKEIAPVMERFGHRGKVVPLKELVKVDYEVPGCPMVEEKFLEVLGIVLKEFGVK